MASSRRKHQRFRVLPLGVCLAAALPALGVAPAPAAASASRTFADVTIDRVDQGQHLVALSGTDVLMLAGDLQDMGIPAGAGIKQQIAGSPFVSLSSLDSEVKYSFSAADLTLALTVGPSLLGKRSISVYDPEDSRKRDHDPGAVWNYDVAASPESAISIDLTQRVSLHHDRSLTNTFGRTIDNRLARGLTTYLWDDPAGLRHLSVGDETIASGDLGGAVALAGIDSEREFSLDPSVIQYPLPSIRTVVLVPSQAQVYVGGALVQTVQLPPGTYNLNNIPVRDGFANAQVVLQNPLGGEQTYSYNLYGDTSLLGKGLTDYAYAAGIQRQNMLEPGDSYRQFAAMGRYRLGLSDFTTAGARFEMTPDVVDGGLSTDAAIMGVDLHLAEAYSDALGIKGEALSAALAKRSSNGSLSVTATFQSPYYSNVSETPTVDHPISEVQAQFSRQFGTTTIAASNGFTNYRDSGFTKWSTISLSRPLGSATVAATFNRSLFSQNRQASNGFAVLLTRLVGPHTLLTATSQGASGSSSQNAIGVEQVNPIPIGLSYDAHVMNGGGFPLSGSVTLGLPMARATFGLVPSGGSQMFGTFDVRGSFALADRGLFFSQPVQGSYATIDAPQLPGARVYLENQFVGWTNKQGKAFIPFLQPNTENHISVSDADVPPESALDQSTESVVPSLNGGSVVHFRLRTVHAVVGTLRIHERSGARVPSYGEFTAVKDGRSTVAEIDERGKFYFEALDAGTYDATIVDAAGICNMHLTVPNFKGVRQDLGALQCDERS